MRVAECFYSIQGEGVTSGMPAVFLRLPGCNLMCGGPRGVLMEDRSATWWCDTEAVWKAGKEMTAADVIDLLPLNAIKALGTHRAHLVVTGGEPALPRNQESLDDFLILLGREWCVHPYLELETNVTIDAPEFYEQFDQINASPKLSNSGIPDALRRVPKVIDTISLHHNSWFKFVVATLTDIEEIHRDWIETLEVPPSRIILMPACDNRDSLATATQFVMEVAMAEGWRCCTRLQILAWNRAVGV